VCSCLAMRLACVCGLSLQPIGCTSALACDEQRYGSCSCRYISVMPLSFFYLSEPYRLLRAGKRLFYFRSCCVVLNHVNKHSRWSPPVVQEEAVKNLLASASSDICATCQKGRDTVTGLWPRDGLHGKLHHFTVPHHLRKWRRMRSTLMFSKKNI